MILTKMVIYSLSMAKLREAREHMSDAYSRWVRIGKLDPNFE